MAAEKQVSVAANLVLVGCCSAIQLQRVFLFLSLPSIQPVSCLIWPDLVDKSVVKLSAKLFVFLLAFLSSHVRAASLDVRAN